MKFKDYSQGTIARTTSTCILLALVSAPSVFALRQDSPTLNSPVQVNQSLLFSFGEWIASVLSTEMPTDSTSFSLTDVNVHNMNKEALITWNASTLASGRVYYSTTSPVSIKTGVLWVAASEYATYANSKANIRNLNASTTYFFIIILENTAGKKIISDESSFTTNP